MQIKFFFVTYDMSKSYFFFWTESDYFLRPQSQEKPRRTLSCAGAIRGSQFHINVNRIHKPWKQFRQMWPKCSLGWHRQGFEWWVWAFRVDPLWDPNPSDTSRWTEERQHCTWPVWDYQAANHFHTRIKKNDFIAIKKKTGVNHVLKKESKIYA